MEARVRGGEGGGEGVEKDRWVGGWARVSEGKREHVVEEGER